MYQEKILIKRSCEHFPISWNFNFPWMGLKGRGIIFIDKTGHQEKLLGAWSFSSLWCQLPEKLILVKNWIVLCFWAWKRPKIKELLPRKVLISFDGAFKVFFVFLDEIWGIRPVPFKRGSAGMHSCSPHSLWLELLNCVQKYLYLFLLCLAFRTYVYNLKEREN